VLDDEALSPFSLLEKRSSGGTTAITTVVLCKKESGCSRAAAAARLMRLSQIDGRALRFQQLHFNAPIMPDRFLYQHAVQHELHEAQMHLAEWEHN
jgi:hypothetical protein